MVLDTQNRDQHLDTLFINIDFVVDVELHKLRKGYLGLS